MVVKAKLTLVLNHKKHHIIAQVVAVLWVGGAQP